jgi:hypothetical protein
LTPLADEFHEMLDVLLKLSEIGADASDFSLAFANTLLVEFARWTFPFT